MADLWAAISRASVSNFCSHSWMSTSPLRNSSLMPGLALTSSGGGFSGRDGAFGTPSHEHERSGRAREKNSKRWREGLIVVRCRGSTGGFAEGAPEGFQTLLLRARRSEERRV